MQRLPKRAKGAPKMTTDELIRELIGEIKKDRVARQREFSDLRLAVNDLGKDFRAFRDHVLKHEDESGKALRLVAAHAGVIDQAEKNGR